MEVLRLEIRAPRNLTEKQIIMLCFMFSMENQDKDSFYQFILKWTVPHWCINDRSSRSDVFCKKETLAQAFSCEFCKIFKNTLFNWTPPVAAFELIWMIPYFKIKLPNFQNEQIGIQLFKVNNENRRIMCKICPKLTMQAPKRRH